MIKLNFNEQLSKISRDLTPDQYEYFEELIFRIDLQDWPQSLKDLLQPILKKNGKGPGLNPYFIETIADWVRGKR